MTFSISWTLIPAALIASSVCARVPGRSRWRTTIEDVAGVWVARFTTLGTVPVSANTRTMRTASAAIASCACSVDAPMWCVPYTLGRPVSSGAKSPVPVDGSSTYTSRPARSPFASIAANSAASSTTSPREVLMKVAPSLMAAKKSAPSMPRVLALRATWTLTTSATDATSCGDAASRTPSWAAASAVRLRLQATTGMPNPFALGIISLPIPPTPISPSVRPYSPFALLYSALFQRPARRSATLSAIRRSSAQTRPKASSATATEFLPGQLET